MRKMLRQLITKQEQTTNRLRDLKNTKFHKLIQPEEYKKKFLSLKQFLRDIVAYSSFFFCWSCDHFKILAS